MDINTIYMIAIVIVVMLAVGAILGVVFSLQRRAKRQKHQS